MKKKLMVAIIVILGIALIGGGCFYLFYLGNNKRIFASAVDEISNELGSAMDFFSVSENNQESYTSTEQMKFDIDVNEQLLTPEYVTLLENISNVDTTIITSYDADNEQSLLTLNSNLNGTELLNMKYLIQDNKQYLFIQDVLANYIELGEMDSNVEITTDEISYLYDTILNSFKNNLRDEYFTTTNNQIITIDGKKARTKKITLSLTDKIVNDIAKNILSDLQQDDRATEILTRFYSDFSNYKMSDTTSDSAYYPEINVYVDSFTFEERMVEFVIEDDYDSIKMQYYLENNLLSIAMNDQVISMTFDRSKENTLTINIMDENNTSIGKIEMVKNGANYNVTGDLTTEELVMSLNYQGTNDQSNLALNMMFYSEDVNVMNFNLTSTGVIEEGAVINEDTTGAVPYDSLDSTFSDNLNQKLTQILVILMTQSNQV